MVARADGTYPKYLWGFLSYRADTICDGQTDGRTGKNNVSQPFVGGGGGGGRHNNIELQYNNIELQYNNIELQCNNIELQYNIELQFNNISLL